MPVPWTITIILGCWDTSGEEVLGVTEQPAAKSSSAPSPDRPELPTQFAELKISVGPIQHLSTEGTVSPDQAHHLVTTFGLLASVVAGVGGAVLTLHVVHGTTGVVLAFAELALALVAAVLIAVVARAPRRRSS